MIEASCFDRESAKESVATLIFSFSPLSMWEKGEYQQIYNKWFGKGTKDYLPLTWKMELWP